MNKTWVWRLLLIFVLLGAVVALAAFAYNLGITRSLAVASVQSGQTAPLAAPYPYYGWWHWGFFPGFGLFACLVPLFLIWIVFFALRGLFFWGRPRHWRRYYGGPGMTESGGGEAWKYGGWQRKAHSVFDEWHRQAHAPAEEEKKEEQ